MKTIAVVGLGYVGIPLAVAFGKTRPTIGFDTSKEKINQFTKNTFPGDEISHDEIQSATHLRFTSDPAGLSQADYVIVAVPTLVNESHQPDFGPLIKASRLVGEHIKPGAIVIYESTVYPGATEEICIPELELASGRKWKEGFHVAYSPERVNPGDKLHTLTSIKKIVSGDDAETLAQVASLYEEIIVPGVHRASCIKVAEAAKVIENTQRDLNIALMNEVAMISHLVGIDTQEVLEAAATKWNFYPLHPGLVGGHCISVVPYYLTSKAEQMGYHPDVILAGRRINDGMSKFIAYQTVKQLIRQGFTIRGAKVAVLGLAFKEDIQDISNSKVVDVIKELEAFGIEVVIHDPYVDTADAKHRYNLTLIDWAELKEFDAVVIATPHKFYRDMTPDLIAQKLKPGGCLIDIPQISDRAAYEALGLSVWRL